MIKIIGGARTPILTVISKILTLQYLDFKIIGGGHGPPGPPGGYGPEARLKILFSQRTTSKTVLKN